MRRVFSNLFYGVVKDIIKDDLSKEELFYLLNQIQHFVFIDEEENICCICVMISETKYDIHLHRKDRVSCKKMYNFMKGVVEYLFENTKCKALINFAPADNKPLLRLMSLFGSQKIITLPNTGVDNKDEVMYIYLKEEK